MSSCQPLDKKECCRSLCYSVVVVVVVDDSVAEGWHGTQGVVCVCAQLVHSTRLTTSTHSTSPPPWQERGEHA